jgi:two-component system invasion response regulator UvrY
MLLEGAKKVALVDDHELFRSALKSHLERGSLGISITLEAENGKTFISQLNQIDASKKPVAVLLDINMPQMNGVDTLRWLKSFHPDIKVIILTMIEDKATVVEMIRLGADAFVKKSASIEKLEEAIEYTVTKGKYISPDITDLLVENLRQGTIPEHQTAGQDLLSDREMEVIRFLCTELSISDIGERMFISARTVDTLRDRIFKKLGVRSRVAAAMWAIRNGLINDGLDDNIGPANTNSTKP